MSHKETSYLVFGKSMLSWKCLVYEYQKNSGEEQGYRTFMTITVIKLHIKALSYKLL